MTPQSIIYAIDLVGTASFAFSGALRAIDRRPDFVGMLILATATAAGGSVLRDVVLNRDVVMLRDWGYPTAILLAVLFTFFWPRAIFQRESVFKYFDALGLGVFSAFTASVTWNTPGVNPLSVLFVATITGCAGGVIRDMMIDKTTLVLSNELYVTPVIFGAVGLMLVEEFRGPRIVGFLMAMAITTGLRLLAMHYNWRLPRILWVEPTARTKAGPAGADSEAGRENAEALSESEIR